jgi:hypothetical protein
MWKIPDYTAKATGKALAALPPHPELLCDVHRTLKVLINADSDSEVWVGPGNLYF